jgi:hypothetical protein
MSKWLFFLLCAPLSAIWHRLVSCRRTIRLMEPYPFPRKLGVRASWDCECGATFPA